MIVHNIIAVLWDFDKTLIPGYMQTPIFDHYGVNEKAFWDSVNEDCLPEYGEQIESKTVRYLNCILKEVSTGDFKGLDNEKLRELGKDIKFFPGVADCMKALKAIPNENDFKEHDLRLEHYVISSGLRQMIRGSEIHDYLDGVWGCELLEDNGVLDRIGYVIDDTTKTRAVYEINKGANIDPDISVNAYMPDHARRVPIDQMIYVADGPSDVPVFSVINKGGGRTYGVYNDQSDDPEDLNQAFDQAYRLAHKENRIMMFGPAAYEKNSHARRWLEHTVRDIAQEIMRRQSEQKRKDIGEAPQHRY